MSVVCDFINKFPQFTLKILVLLLLLFSREHKSLNSTQIFYLPFRQDKKKHTTEEIKITLVSQSSNSETTTVI